MQWSYTNAVSRLPVGISLLIEYTAAIWVPVFSWIIFKQKAGKQLWLGAALALAGLLVVSQIWNSTLDPVGIAFAFMAAASVTFYFIIAEHTQHARDSYSTLFYTMLISTLFWLAVNHPSMSAYPNLQSAISLGGSFGSLALPTWVMLLWLGIFGSFLPMLLTYLGLKNLGATASGIGSTSEVVFAFLFGWLWLQEDISGIQLVGAVFVLFGIGIAQTARSK
jgi:drug/metabolite transporter (DMT)-like permease